MNIDKIIESGELDKIQHDEWCELNGAEWSIPAPDESIDLCHCYARACISKGYKLGDENWFDNFVEAKKLANWLRAENAALREALYRIVSWPGDLIDSGTHVGRDNPREIAAEALCGVSTNLAEIDTSPGRVDASEEKGHVDMPHTGYDIDEKRLRSTLDASVWADEFCRLWPQVNAGVMIGWFANAIEQARAEHGLRPEVLAFAREFQDAPMPPGVKDNKYHLAQIRAAASRIEAQANHHRRNAASIAHHAMMIADNARQEIDQ